jgi:hypothetical protein
MSSAWESIRAGRAGLALVVGLPILEITEAEAEIVAGYVRHRLMPADPAGDAQPRITSATSR